MVVKSAGLCVVCGVHQSVVVSTIVICGSVYHKLDLYICTTSRLLFLAGHAVGTN